MSKKIEKEELYELLKNLPKNSFIKFLDFNLDINLNNEFQGAHDDKVYNLINHLIESDRIDEFSSKIRIKDKIHGGSVFVNKLDACLNSVTNDNGDPSKWLSEINLALAFQEFHRALHVLMDFPDHFGLPNTYKDSATLIFKEFAVFYKDYYENHEGNLKPVRIEEFKECDQELILRASRLATNIYEDIKNIFQGLPVNNFRNSSVGRAA